jgi:hypothetical protein
MKTFRLNCNSWGAHFPKVLLPPLPPPPPEGPQMMQQKAIFQKIASNPLKVCCFSSSHEGRYLGHNLQVAAGSLL